MLMINTINKNSSIINSARNNNNLQTLHVSPLRPPAPNIINPRFSPSQNSPCLNDSSHTISFASLNVRGINNPCKFDDILDDFINDKLSVIGLQETKLKESNADFMFQSFISSHHPNDRYKAYWSFNPLDSSGGVGLIVAPFVSKYIQRIHRHKSRFIAIDLFFPSKKLKVINIYNFQQGDFIRSGKTFAKFVIQHIEDAKKADFKVVIMGDFNLDASTYFDVLTKGRTPPAFFTLTKFLTENDFIDQHSLDSDGLEYASHYVNNRPISRIDQIWFSDDLLSSEYCFDRVWSLTCTEYDTNSIFNLDHRCIIVYFTKALFIGDLPSHRVKQKKEWRSIYDISSTTQEHWNYFQQHITSELRNKDCNANIPTDSIIPLDRCVLNAKWSAFRRTVEEAAKAHIPHKKVSPDAFKQLEEDENIIRLKLHIAK